MKNQHNLLKKLMKLCILTALTAAVLSGCGQEPRLFPAYGVSSGSGMFTKEVCLKCLTVQESAWQNFISRNMPEIEAEDYVVNVKIHNAKEYLAFVSCLEEYVDYGVLWLDMAETDTAVYLDEILAYHNFEILRIKQGGTLLVRDIDNLYDCPLRKLYLYHIYAIEEGILSRMPSLQDITIRLNSWYDGVLPDKGLLQKTTCRSIVMIWDDDRKEEVHLEELPEWDKINAVLSENDRYLKALYVLNEGDYSYACYEFCRCGNTCDPESCEAFISIKDRESYGEQYFDILDVPVGHIDSLSWLEGSRVRLDDVNFDGYRDLIFIGENELMGYRYRCIGFLWNEKEQRYEWNASVPKMIRGIDTERKRIEYSWSSGAIEGYYIYEYNGSIFTEKSLELIFSGDHVTWQYYEEGELKKTLERTYDEEEKLYYIRYEENGTVTEEVMEEADYENKYGLHINLGKEYFPEFDFYWAG